MEDKRSFGEPTAMLPDRGIQPNAHANNISIDKEYILNADGTMLVDHHGYPVTVDKFLASKPLRAVISSRQGPGGKKLEYMPGEVVTQTLNEAFGYDGWSLEVKNTAREDTIKDDKGRYIVAYTATVRITHRRSEVYREDCGSGDACDRSLGTASGHALKGAITDAMKRAARHFGEKLGNALYHDNFTMNGAPPTLKDALEKLDVQRANSRFGFDKNRNHSSNQNIPVIQHHTTKQNQRSEEMKQVVDSLPHDESVYASHQAELNPQKSRVLNQATRMVSSSNPTSIGTTASNSAHITPPESTTFRALRNSLDSIIDFPNFEAIASKPTEEVGKIYSGTSADDLNMWSAKNGKNNPNPQLKSTSGSTGGLNLPQRPGTSRGVVPPVLINSTTNSDGKSLCEALGSPLLLTKPGVHPGITLGFNQSKPDSSTKDLKRKGESLDCSDRRSLVKTVNAGVKNPYNGEF